MNQHEISIRPANPTLDEGKQFAIYMNSASDGGLGKMFGKRFEQIVSTAYLEPNHDLSHETALFAEFDGRIIGMASGYTPSNIRGSVRMWSTKLLDAVCTESHSSTH